MVTKIPQIGGDHYHSEYPHWDLALVVPLQYLEAAATKYVVRWRKKGSPVEDLRKSLSYLNKLERDGFLLSRRLTHVEIVSEVLRFSAANGLGDLERAYVNILSTWQGKEELFEARQLLFSLLDEAEGRPKSVPLTEENHHSPRVGQTDEVDNVGGA